MIKTIFVKNDNKIDTYIINIDESEIRKIETDIDSYNGKGEILTKKTDVLSYAEDFSLIGKKIEIISKEFAGKGHRIHYCCGDIDNINLYNYKYYAYIPHQLSKLCTNILDSTSTLELSSHIKEVLDHHSKDDTEKISLKE